MTSPIRPIVHTVRVQPGLNVIVEDSHCILLQVTSPDGGRELFRTAALSDIDTLEQALHAARLWVAARDQ